MALLAACRACEAAGLTELNRIAAGFAALTEGRPPPPFDAPDRVWQALESDPRLPDRIVGRPIPPERPPFRPPARDGAHTPVPEPEQTPQTVGPAPAMKSPSPPARTPKPQRRRTRWRSRSGAPDPSLPVTVAAVRLWLRS
ncbi:hypothetical protein SAV14893_087150 [Streptomyces avermitilis]|uniref:Uncharacterized protein n=1 Tax=Streptomyces avermitilis TaxID=33903 RepID=A0A4D4N7V3_STRAX|nr:hypothetical protein SAVMC3_09380 [Streptomyces avermitilis]GDY69322.1 hypothetical protein SAV14893_087150 [Streptomyces avermitilis]GDY79575.1 hypothetical protein SAV31267_090600 [Streptomyces avermitilis]GDY80814.1 hypothetical protein SAVCW2_00130 [Streptomyces avermitilis]GDY80841.1 hypothetical protein SAVCW2_00400 [Streptomyces avermitilis]